MRLESLGIETRNSPGSERLYGNLTGHFVFKTAIAIRKSKAMSKRCLDRSLLPRLDCPIENALRIGLDPENIQCSIRTIQNLELRLQNILCRGSALNRKNTWRTFAKNAYK